MLQKYLENKNNYCSSALQVSSILVMLSLLIHLNVVINLISLSYSYQVMLMPNFVSLTTCHSGCAHFHIQLSLPKKMLWHLVVEWRRWIIVIKTLRVCILRFWLLNFTSEKKGERIHSEKRKKMWRNWERERKKSGSCWNFYVF